MGRPARADTPAGASLATVDGWIRLGAAMLARAGDDAREGDLGACEWLEGDMAGLIAGVIGVDQVEITRRAAAWAAEPAGAIVIRLCVEG